MGLTLNTNSLNLATSGGSAGTGLSTSDVTTLIKNNTPYTFISKVDCDGTNNIVEFPLVEADYINYKVLAHFDLIASTYMMGYFYSGGSSLGSAYKHANPYTRSSSQSNYQQSNDAQIYFGQADYEHPVTFEMDFSIDPNFTNRPFRFLLGASHSSNEGVFIRGGGAFASSGSIDKVRFQTANNNFANGGTFKLYGVNQDA